MARKDAKTQRREGYLSAVADRSGPQFLCASASLREEKKE